MPVNLRIKGRHQPAAWPTKWPLGGSAKTCTFAFRWWTWSPPLRDHKEDIAELAAYFMAQLAPSLGVEPLQISAPEMDYLQQYDWPGNVRELRNLVERSLILGAINVSALYPGAGTARNTQASTSAHRPAHAGETAHFVGAGIGAGGQKPGCAAAGRVAAHAGTPRRRMGRLAKPSPPPRFARPAPVGVTYRTWYCQSRVPGWGTSRRSRPDMIRHTPRWLAISVRNRLPGHGAATTAGGVSAAGAGHCGGATSPMTGCSSPRCAATWRWRVATLTRC